jgi:hypothetical protein
MWTLSSWVLPLTVSIGNSTVKVEPSPSNLGREFRRPSIRPDVGQDPLSELIAKVNDQFEGDLTPGDKLVYVNDVIKSKLMESEKLAEQEPNNTKEQLANSPDLAKEIMGACFLPFG